MNQKLKEKAILLGISTLVVILFSIVIVYVRFIERGKVQYPVSTLNLVNAGTECVENNMFPYYYTFVDAPYMIGVPGEGSSYVDGGYTYITNKDFGLVVTEYSKDRTFEGYLRDILGALYANVGENTKLTIERSSNGYRNGFPADEYICRAKFEGHSNLIIYAYSLDAGTKNITTIALVDMPTNEKMLEIRDYLDAMTKMIRPIARDNTIGKEDVSEGSVLSDNAPSEMIETKADVTADKDYTLLRLSFVYIDINAEIEEITVTTSEGDVFEAAEMNNGEVIFLIPQVKAGDKLTFNVKAGDLSGSYVEMAEQTDYLEEQEALKEGNLHIEEEEVSE